MIMTAEQMKAAEDAAFCKGSTPAGLIEIAGEEIASVIHQYFPKPSTLVVFCGKGHNGGDALVVARHLEVQGWNILIRLTTSVDEMSPLAREHLESLEHSQCISSLPPIFGPLVILDGLLGIGAVGAPKGIIADQIIEMNHLRVKYGGFTVAVDIPSGLDATTGEVFTPCVQSDLTVTVGGVKSGLVADTATPVVGRIALVPLPDLFFSEGDPASLITPTQLRHLLPIRDFDTFKGSYGRIGILAGSLGYLGAARLVSSASVHAGAGLVTLYALPDSYEILAAACIPEVMVHRIEAYSDVFMEKLDVLALGPGLGAAYHEELRSVVRDVAHPCVVDADALNAVSADTSLLSHCVGPRLLTPHPGEMERLFPRMGRSRRDWATEFVTSYPVTLLLKGARTIIAEQGCPPVFNSTGNPGMGSGGMGDVLTGVSAALIGGGHSPRDAAMLGAWICGRAAEIAVFNDQDSQESLAASSVITHLGEAFSSLRKADC
ncbi:MAG: NAD(P)H-hydrate dehydratase [Verrucomicrobia bacterium]|nr:MAG: NAD(P)H-hydrate dehydratase [Verrucomicrobiota bacterium]